MRYSIPKTWRKRKLADIAVVQTGIAKGKKNIADPVTRPYLRVANVQDGHLDLSEIKTIEVSRHELDRFSLNVGDVLFTEGGDFDKLGRGTVYQGEVPNCLHQNHVFAVRMKNGEMLPYFLATYAASFWGRTYFLSCSKQTTNLASINSTQLKEMPLPVPPLPEQRKIAAILSTWDRAIELTEKLIAAKQRRKQALMQQLLTGKVRLPGFKGQKWQLRKIGQFLTESRIAGSDGENAKKITVKLYGKGVLPKIETRKGSSATQYYRRSAGQFIYSKLDFLNGAFGIIPPAVDGFESTLDLPAFDINDEMDSRWFLGFVSREQFYSRGFSLANGGRKARRVNPRDFLNIKIKLPSLPEQHAIANVLETADREVLHLSVKLDALKRQKRGLMQQLLTGKIRVHVEDNQ